MKQFIIILIGLSLLIFGVTYGDEYKIGSEDILQINFWEEASLNTQVRVADDGTITLDIIGQIQAAGKTTKELQEEIGSAMYSLRKKVSQAVVRVVTYNFQHIFVSGQVNAGGRMAFENIPDLWTAINLAGGITLSGDLSRVTIVRGGDHAGQVEIVNVAAAIADGSLGKLPKLRRGDTVDIPRTPGGIPSGALSSKVDVKNTFFVVGAVNQPGPKTFVSNLDLYQAIAMAGGYVENADLSRVKVLSRDGWNSQVYEFNLSKLAETGSPARYIIKEEDTFIIPHRKQAGFLGLNWGTMATVAGVLTSGLLIYESVKPNEN